MVDPSPRRLLYALVAGAFHALTGVMVLMTAFLLPRWWTFVAGGVWLGVALVMALRWQRTGLVLGLGVAGFVAELAGVALLVS